MKILYVEDDLGGNIPRILNLFGDLLPKRIREGLQDAEADERGASNPHVKQLLDQSGIVHACYDFSDAIRTVQGKWQYYKLFILDRNLTDGQGEWDPDEICEAAGVEDHDLLLPFLTREGDFLVHMLIPKLHADLGHMVYFLTANTTDAELKSSPEFKFQMHACDIGPQNFIQKSDTEACQGLRDIIMSIDALRIKAQHLDLFKAIELCAPDEEGSLVKIMAKPPKADADDWKRAMSDMRRIKEASLLAVRNRLVDSRRQTDDPLLDVFGTDEKNFKFKKENSDIRSCFQTLQALASMYAAHYPGEKVMREDIYNICYGAFRVILRWTGEKLSQT